MNLNDRLNALRNPQAAPTEVEPPVATVAVDRSRRRRDPRGRRHPARRSFTPRSRRRRLRRSRRWCSRWSNTRAAVDPLASVKEKAAQELFVRIGSRLNDSTLTEEQLHLLARAELAEIVAAEQLALSTSERNRLIDDIGADVLGYGPLEALLEDDSVSEIMVNRSDQIYVERYGRLLETPHRFTGEAQLRRVIERIVAASAAASTSRRRSSTPASRTARA